MKTFVFQCKSAFTVKRLKKEKLKIYSQVQKNNWNNKLLGRNVLEYFLRIPHFHLLSHTELMRLQVWSGLQVMVPLPLTCWPLGQVTRMDWPTWKLGWGRVLPPSSLQPGGGGQRLAAKEGNDGLWKSHKRGNNYFLLPGSCIATWCVLVGVTSMWAERITVSPT